MEFEIFSVERVAGTIPEPTQGNKQNSWMAAAGLSGGRNIKETGWRICRIADE